MWSSGWFCLSQAGASTNAFDVFAETGTAAGPSRAGAHRTETATAGAARQGLGEIPALLKWTALEAFPQSDVAGLSGEPWLAFLDKTIGGKNFTDGEGDCCLCWLCPGRADNANFG